MIEVIITTLSIIGWALSVWMHPRLSESCIQHDSSNSAIDEAFAEFVNQIVDAGEVVTVPTGRDRKTSNASEDDCGFYIEIDESLPQAICIIPTTTFPTDEPTIPNSVARLGVRGFGILIQSHSSSELLEHQTS